MSDARRHGSIVTVVGGVAAPPASVARYAHAQRAARRPSFSTNIYAKPRLMSRRHVYSFRLSMRRTGAVAARFAIRMRQQKMGGVGTSALSTARPSRLYPHGG